MKYGTENLDQAFIVFLLAKMSAQQALETLEEYKQGKRQPEKHT